MLKYQGIADALRREIECGLYLPGEQIPLEETLGRQFRVCRGTVKRAMDLLVAQGLLARRRGAGAFVKALPGADVKELSMAHQLSGFAKKDDLKYFLSEICNVDYFHLSELAPTKLILQPYQKKEISWDQYADKFLNLMAQRNIERTISKELLQDSCLLCSEHLPHQCHRRLVVEYLQAQWPDVSFEVRHLK